MNEAYDAAQEDFDFQMFMARTIGTPVIGKNLVTGEPVTGYFYKDEVFVPPQRPPISPEPSQH